MKRNLFLLCGLIGLLLSAGCREHQTKSPQLEARYDRSVTPAEVDVEKALQNQKQLKLSQIASEIEYYIVGDANYHVAQAIALPDSNAFITFNNPRIYYRRQGKPSKRYGFKALTYKWNNEMNGRSLFYDKKTTRMYVALSGKDIENKESDQPGIPCIGELPPLETMLTVTNFIHPENLEKKYPIKSEWSKLLGFSSTGYTLCDYWREGNVQGSITTFNLQGDTLCKIPLYKPSSSFNTNEIPSFQTSYWNEAQDRMTFMVPYCDTVYQLTDAHIVAPLFHIHFGKQGIGPNLPAGQPVPAGTIWLHTLFENPKGLFLGLYQKKHPPLVNWLGNIEEFRPPLTQQVLYLKEENEAYLIPGKSGGLENDLDDGFPFWPDGQTDDYLYMIRSITEMRTTLERNGSPRQQKLIELLDDKTVKENQFVIVVVR